MPRSRRCLATLLLVVLVGLVLFPGPVAQSQDGRGVIVEGNLTGAASTGSLNPLRCTDQEACQRVVDFLFPRLVGVDPVTGRVAPASESGAIPLALAESWAVSSDGLVYTFHLRDDLTWSDGTPIDAYDVFYSYLAIISGELWWGPYRPMLNNTTAGAVPLDAYTFALIFREATCYVINVAYFPIIPAHVFDAEFATTASVLFNAEDDAHAQFERWQAEHEEYDFAPVLDYRLSNGYPFDDSPSVTAGVFEFDTRQPTDYIRLVSHDGLLNYNFIDVPDRATQVAMFLSGEINLIVNPPVEFRHDIRAMDDVQVYEAPGTAWHYINLNIADPRNPQSVVDDDGVPLDQGQHPIFGDVRVRRALQLAIDVDTLIETAALGDGTTLASSILPSSWAYNSDLAPVPYDPVAAAQMLEDAGWKDINDDGIRVCIGCLYAPENTRLAFELLYYDTSDMPHAVIARLIEQQLALVGVEVWAQGVEFGTLYDAASTQRYDAYLHTSVLPYPFDPDQTVRFSSAWDILDTGFNTGSYANARVDSLLYEALTLPGCDVQARTALYYELQEILQTDQPYLWLYAPHDFVATRGSVTGFDPQPNAPFWNIHTWSVAEIENP